MPETDPAGRRWYTRKEAAAVLGYSERTISRWGSTRKPPLPTIPGPWAWLRYDADAIDAWVADPRNRITYVRYVGGDE